MGDRRANQGSGHLQAGFKPKPEIVYILVLNGPDRPPQTSKQVEDEALHLVWSGLEADRALSEPKYRRLPVPAYAKVIPKWFFGQVLFWRPGAPRPNNYTFLGT